MNIKLKMKGRILRISRSSKDYSCFRELWLWLNFKAWPQLPFKCCFWKVMLILYQH